ncbi:MAG TPA: type II toxin-antitoxin system VapC family toxin, partial [Rhodopila sp.]
DTCVISEARRRTPQAVSWLRSTRSETLFLSVISIGEIMKGVTMKLRTDPRAAAVLLRWLDELRLVYSTRILPVDDAVATSWGRLMAERSRPVLDTLIAATARAHNKIVVTRNVADFADTGVTILDPWAMMP